MPGGTERQKLDEALLAEGAAALAAGDHEAAERALRLAKEIQDAAERNAPRERPN